MNFFIPFLMLIVPGVIAVSIHDKQMINITRENWQALMWKFLLYSFAIVFVVNLVMFLSYPQRTISFSSWTTWTSSHVLIAGFVVKYTVIAVASAFALPNLWERRNKIFDTIKKRKSFKISDDE